jgi:DNA-binding MarR family transcriptional regulator
MRMVSKKKLLSKTVAETSAKTKSPGKRSGDRSLFDDFMPHLIARLAYELHKDLIEKLRLEGINVTRWRILAVLSMGDGITINEIIDRAMMQQSALSRALMKMEAEDYVRRISRRDDARYVEVFITDKGRGLFATLNRVVISRQKKLLKGFSDSEIDGAFDLLRRMSRNISSP